MRKKIKVTRKFISNGKPCSGTDCPIALAIKSNIGGIVQVGLESANFTKNGRKWHQSNLSKQASKFISDFDKLKAVKPFSFFITLPKNYIQ